MKLNLVCLDLVSEQMVTAGKGMPQTGVGLWAKLTMTGDVSHFLYVAKIKSIQR